MDNTILVCHLDDEVCVKINSYTPGRPAPIAHCPDSPGFDDEGSAEEVEFEVIHEYPVIVAFLEGDEDFRESVLEECRRD